jgi:RNA polymerase sigma factor (sigma-70 family)
MSDERFERLVEAHQEKVVGYLMKFRRALSKEDARDVAQVVLFEISRRIDKIADGSEVAYLYTAARNRALRLLKQRAARAEDDLDAEIEHDDRRPGAEEQLLRREQQSATEARIRDALASLPEVTRLCVVGRIRGFTCEEIAGRLQMTSVAVRSRLSRAYEQLHQAVGEVPDWFEWPETAEGDGHGDEK